MLGKTDVLGAKNDDSAPNTEVEMFNFEKPVELSVLFDDGVCFATSTVATSVLGCLACVIDDGALGPLELSAEDDANFSVPIPLPDVVAPLQPALSEHLPSFSVLCRLLIAAATGLHSNKLKGNLGNRSGVAPFARSVSLDFDLRLSALSPEVTSSACKALASPSSISESSVPSYANARSSRHLNSIINFYV